MERSPITRRMTWSRKFRGENRARCRCCKPRTFEGSMPEAAWDEKLLADPHAVADKRRRVQQMFAAIAPKYDLNNRLHSFWRDQAWRRKAVKLSKVQWTERVVDVACGTGDLTIAFLNEMRRQHPDFTRWPDEL